MEGLLSAVDPIVKMVLIKNLRKSFVLKHYTFSEGDEKKKDLELQAVRLRFLRNDSWYPTERSPSPASRLHSSSFPVGE